MNDATRPLENASFPSVDVESPTRTDDERGVATLTLNRPRRCNALSFELARRLLGELRQIERDSTIKIVLLRGVGPHFCGGLDLREATFGPPIPRAAFETPDFVDARSVRTQELFGDAPFGESVPRAAATPRLVQLILRQIRLLPQLVVARASGAACGGGAGIVAVCDYVVVDSTFRAAFTETKRGLFPTLLFPFLRRKLPISALQEAVLTAAPISAERARELGLVQEIVAPETLDAAVDAALARFLTNEPNALRAAKRLFNRELLPDDAEILDGWREHFRSWRSAAGREGIAAFLEKREPKPLINAN